MHQLVEKINIFAQRCGIKILDLLRRTHAISVHLAGNILIILKLVLEKTCLFTKASAKIILKILRRTNADLATLSKKTLVILKLVLKKTVLFTKASARTNLKILQRFYAALVTFSKKSLSILIQVSRSISNGVKPYWLFTKDRAVQYYYLVRLDKPIGTLLLLWPTLWALWIAAEGTPDFDILIIFILGVIITRSAGCIVNDLADRDLDRHISRTSNRPITSGKVKPLEAVGLATVLLACAIILVLNLNALTIRLSFVAVLLAIIYPFMKRFTYLPQVFLGMAFGWSVPMAFAAQTNSIPEIAWLIFITTVLWAIVYDTMYAMVDKEDDLKIGVKSTAILFDDADRIIIGSIQLMILFAQLLTGSKLGLGQYYYAGIAIASVLSIYQQYLIKDRIPENCFRAFLNNQWYGMVVFAGLYLNYMFG